jgi:hypothetical protein
LTISGAFILSKRIVMNPSSDSSSKKTNKIGHVISYVLVTLFLQSIVFYISRWTGIVYGTWLFVLSFLYLVVLFFVVDSTYWILIYSWLMIQTLQIFSKLYSQNYVESIPSNAYIDSIECANEV